MCVENCCDLNILVRIFFLKKIEKKPHQVPNSYKNEKLMLWKLGHVASEILIFM